MAPPSTDRSEARRAALLAAYDQQLRELSEVTFAVQVDHDGPLGRAVTRRASASCRIARLWASLLRGPLGNGLHGEESTLPFELGTDKRNWVQKRLNKRGLRSNATRRNSDVFAIRIKSAVKRAPREMFVNQSGLQKSAVYPIPWHHPMPQEFASTH